MIHVGKSKFDVHKKFLSLWSPYFEALFSENWSNGQNQEDNLNYDLNEEFLDEKNFKIIVEYLYSGDISLNLDKSCSLCIVADYFQFSALKKLCEEFFIKNITIDNIIDLMKIIDLATKIELEDFNKNIKIFLFGFGQIILNIHDFSFYDFEDFTRILSELMNYWYYPKIKERYLDVIINWIQHDSSKRQIYLEDLFSKFISFKEFSLEFLIEKVSEIDLIRSSEKLNDSLLEAMTEIEEKSKIKIVPEVNPSKDNRLFLKSLERNPSWRCTSIYNKKIYLACFGVIHVYDGENDKMQDPIPMNIYKDMRMACLNGFIYIASGHDRNGTELRRYSIETKQWTLLKSMKKARKNFKLVSLNNHLYAIGGCDETVERYDPETNVWKFVSSINSGNVPTSATSHNGFIYVLTEKLLEVYNPTKNLWIPLKKSGKEYSKKHFRLFSFNDHLLAVKSPYSRKPGIILKFDLYSNEWQTSKEIPFIY